LSFHLAVALEAGHLLHCPGLWHGELTLSYTGDGRRQRQKVSGKTKAAVVDKLRDLHAQLDKGITHKVG